MKLHPHQPLIRGHYLTFSSSEEALFLTFFALAGEGSVVSSSFFFALLGVEIGQLTVVLLAFIIVGYWFNKKDYYQISIANPISIIIGLVGAYWFIERVI